VPDFVASRISLSYGRGAECVSALRDISVAFAPGMLHVIAGPILLSLEVRGTTAAAERCIESLIKVGLEAKAHLTPDQMSGGEQQRVAIARAIAHGPSIVLADEPTANLDSVNGQNIITLLRNIAHDPSRVVIIVSHDSRVFSLADRLIRIENGRLIGDEVCSAAL
jgi:putative ABC transport system ATP-binding protein